MLETSLIVSLLVIVVLIVLSAFFSGSETGLTAISRARIYRLETEGNRRAKLVHRLRNKKEALIGTILLGNNLVNIAASALATSVAIKLWGDNGVWYITIIMTLVVLVFAEVMPKTFAINNPEKVALFVAPVFVWLVKFFAPITAAIQAIINTTLRIFGVDLKPGATLISAVDALRGTIELQHRDGDIVKLDRDMLGGILDLAHTEVGEVMVHRKNILTIDMALPVADIIRIAVDSDHSRLPLWQDDPDNIIGIIHIRDLMKAMQNNAPKTLTHEDISQLLAKPWFIPESTNLRDQLLAFRHMRQHFALVVDEYGALLGILTLEDILEEIVGEIDDEHDQPDSGEITTEAAENSYSVEGKVTLRDLNRFLEWSLPDDNANTIAGLLIHEARLIPEVGEEFEFHGCHFTVLKKDGNQITRLRLARLNDPLAEDDDDD
ncbi:MAG: HlyC/CorC family transporter [Alphaproteobacteria bacterium]|nr:HlyC/CorC family transporter [Alphaproteobacteria bacterium]